MAASLAAGSERQGHPVTLVLGTDRGHRPRGTRMLDRLAEVEPAPEADGWRLPWLLERQDHGGALVAVTGALDPAVFGRLALQRRRFAPVIVVSIAEGSSLRSGRRFGTVVIEAPTAGEFAAAWNHLVHR